jgi:hypothetical protein
MTLNPSAKALLQAGREAIRPTAADRERIQRALSARLGSAALLNSAEPAASQPVPKPWRTVLSTAAAGVGVAGTALFLALRTPAPPPVDRALAVASATPVVAAKLQAREEASSAPALPSVAASAPASRRMPDRLAQEVSILSRAASELHAGRAASALKAIDEHQARFPNGLLSEERRAARARALCALGRRAEADAELGRLARVAPQSPHVARARQFCSATQRPR